MKEGSVITVRNAHANVVKEHLRIEVDRWAKVETAPKDAAASVAESVNLAKNASEIEYELVTVMK